MKILKAEIHEKFRQRARLESLIEGNERIARTQFCRSKKILEE